MPFYPSPNRDDGYDISDFYGVDPRLGTLGDFVEFVRTAGDRGIRVILDLVVNHTSDEHPWFAESRSSTDSPRRDWYVWRPGALRPTPRASRSPTRRRRTGSATGARASTTCTASTASSPTSTSPTRPCATRSARSRRSGSRSGVSGFRMDAVPFLLELDGITEHMDGDPKGWLRRLRSFVGRRNGEAMLLGEVNTAMKDLSSYFGGADGDALHMEFAFLLNQSLWLSLARGEAEPLEQMISSLPVVPHDNAWATFLRNHDELTLDKLTVSQREEVFAAFGPKPGHADVRPRAAAPDGADARRRRAAAADGVEPDVLAARHARRVHGRRDRDGRAAERSPTATRSACRCTGRARATAASRPRRRRTSSARCRAARSAPAKVNVEDQRRDPDSLLRFFRHLVRARSSARRDVVVLQLRLRPRGPDRRAPDRVDLGRGAPGAARRAARTDRDRDPPGGRAPAPDGGGPRRRAGGRPRARLDVDAAALRRARGAHLRAGRGRARLRPHAPRRRRRRRTGSACSRPRAPPR